MDLKNFRPQIARIGEGEKKVVAVDNSSSGMNSES
jgi:hypothetical protein